MISERTNRRCKTIMPLKNLGKIGNGYICNTMKLVSDEELDKFVEEEIEYGPQIVTIPVPPFRHAFLVDVQEDVIMISDWRGKTNRTSGLIEKKIIKKK